MLSMDNKKVSSEGGGESFFSILKKIQNIKIKKSQNLFVDKFVIISNF